MSRSHNSRLRRWIIEGFSQVSRLCFESGMALLMVFDGEKKNEL